MIKSQPNVIKCMTKNQIHNLKNVKKEIIVLKKIKYPSKSQMYTNGLHFIILLNVNQYGLLL